MHQPTPADSEEPGGVGTGGNGGDGGDGGKGVFKGSSYGAGISGVGVGGGSGEGGGNEGVTNSFDLLRAITV